MCASGAFCWYMGASGVCGQYMDVCGWYMGVNGFCGWYIWVCVAGICVCVAACDSTDSCHSFRCYHTRMPYCRPHQAALAQTSILGTVYSQQPPVYLFWLLYSKVKLALNSHMYIYFTLIKNPSYKVINYPQENRHFLARSSVSKLVNCILNY